MVNRFKYDLRYLHVFVILFKQSDNRMTAVRPGAVVASCNCCRQALWNMLKIFQTMFGPDFWKNAMLAATHWSYSPRLAGVRAEAGLTERGWTQQFNSRLQADFNFDFDLPAVFIDTFHNRARPAETEQFQRNVAVLWSFAQDRLGRRGHAATVLSFFTLSSMLESVILRITTLVFIFIIQLAADVHVKCESNLFVSDCRTGV